VKVLIEVILPVKSTGFCPLIIQRNHNSCVVPRSFIIPFMILAMTLEYEYFEPYDLDCGDEIDLEGQIREWLWTMDLMLEFVSTQKSDILDTFLEKVASKYESDLGTESHVLSDVSLDKILNDESVLGLQHVSLTHVKHICQICKGTYAHQCHVHQIPCRLYSSPSPMDRVLEE